MKTDFLQQNSAAYGKGETPFPYAALKYIETTKKFYAELLTLAAPLAAQTLITTGVNMVDNIMVGQLGETALSATTLATQFVMLYQFCIMGVSMGTSVLTSRFWGAKDMTAMKKAVTIALRIGGLFSLLVTAVSTALAPQIMMIFSREQDIILSGASYLVWSMPTYLLTALILVCTNVLRSVGLAAVPFAASLAAFGVNIGANYIFIFGKLGMPAMGVAGAALGTVIARVIEAGIICGYFFLFDRRIGYRVRDLLSRCGDLLREFWRISMPVLVSDGLLGVGDSVLAIIMGHIGTQFVSANSITAVTQRISTIFISSIAFASCFMIGKVLGEGRIEDAKKQGVTFCVLGAVIGALACVLIQLLKGPIIGAYNIQPETKLLTQELMNGISVIVIFRSLNSILTKGVLRGGGDTRVLMAADAGFLWAVSIPLGAAAGLVWHLPAFWVYLCLYLDQILKTVWCLFRLKSGKWIKKIQAS